MASLELPPDSSSDDDQVKEQSQESHFSLHATQTMYDSAEQEIYGLGSSVANRSRSIEVESDLHEEPENESEDELPMSQSEESEANRSRLKKQKKRSRKDIRVASETEKSSDEEDVIDETQGSSRTSKFSTIKKEEAEMKKTIALLGKTVKENKAKGKPPAKPDKTTHYTSPVWGKDAFHYKNIDGIVNKKIVVCGQCKNEFNKHSGTTNLRNHMKSQHSEFWKKVTDVMNYQPKVCTYLNTTKQ